jgi:hypothetical protein
MTNFPNTNYHPADAAVVNRMQFANDNTDTWSVLMDRNITLNYCRMRTREGPREAGGSNQVHALNWCFIQHYMVGSDHSDGIQAYGAGGNPAPILRLRNTHIQNDGGHCGLFVADGVRLAMDLEDVLFSVINNGQFGLRVHDDIGGGAVTLRMKNVYFVQSGWNNDACFINQSGGGTNPPKVTLWENVRWCTLSNGVFTPGALIPRPSGT